MTQAKLNPKRRAEHRMRSLCPLTSTHPPPSSPSKQRHAQTYMAPPIMCRGGRDGGRGSPLGTARPRTHPTGRGRARNEAELCKAVRTTRRARVQQVNAAKGDVTSICQDTQRPCLHALSDVPCKTTIEVQHKEKGISKSSNNHFHNAYAYHVTFPCMLHLRKDDTER